MIPRISIAKHLALVVLGAAALSAQSTLAQQATYASIPSTDSEEAGTFLGYLDNPNEAPVMPAPDQIEAWEALQQQTIAGTEERTKNVIKRFQSVVKAETLGGVPVLVIEPNGWKDNGKLVIHTHGGGYTLYDAMSSIPSSAAIAVATGMRVISVDYRPAPQSRWQNTLEQVTSVFKGLLRQGYGMGDLVIYGDSAGGALAAGAVLKMRNEEIGMPAAVVLWSPWSDIDNTRGDTYQTLRDADPIVGIDSSLVPSALAYADVNDFSHPYVSPVHGDYTKGYPPTLIQGGTKEIFLSNFVRLYQAIDVAGQEVTLDLYEGMPHIFQYLILDAPESKRAIRTTADFMIEHLGGIKPRQNIGASK